MYLTAGMENLLEEMVLQCLPAEEDHMLTASVLEHAIANNGDLWGLLQPYAHLNAGRTATGTSSGSGLGAGRGGILVLRLLKGSMLGGKWRDVCLRDSGLPKINS